MNEMIFDSMTRGGSALPESSCRRQNAEAKRGERLRRKRMELRRLRTVAKEKSYGDEGGGEKSDSSEKCSKKVRTENEIEIEIEPSITKSSLRILTAPLLNQVLHKSDSKSQSNRDSHGTMSVIGRRREMEDAVAVELGFMRKEERIYDLYGVYDGHGGWRVARSCGERLHKLLVEVMKEEEESEYCGVVINWGKVMREGFRRMDEEVNRNGGTAVAMTGSTAVVAVVGEDEVVVANCGDSRAVLSRGGEAVQLLEDHKPDRPDELKRIEVAGGKVINWNGHRVLGVLATSRSIGDHYLKPYVIPEPEVKVINRTNSDEFLILASDGLWDVISNDLACRVTRKCLEGHIKRKPQFPIPEHENNQNDSPHSQNATTEETLATEAAAVLTELALARGSRDNISVIVVDLRGKTGGCSSR